MPSHRAERYDAPLYSTPLIPIFQRFARDINTASNHVIFERETRYGDHVRQLLGQPITNRLA